MTALAPVKVKKFSQYQWALSIKKSITKNEFRVLLALSHYAHSVDVVFMKFDAIMDHACQSKPTLIAALNRLVARGLIVPIPSTQRGTNGKHGPMHYLLTGKSHSQSEMPSTPDFKGGFMVASTPWIVRQKDVDAALKIAAAICTQRKTIWDAHKGCKNVVNIELITRCMGSNSLPHMGSKRSTPLTEQSTEKKKEERSADLRKSSEAASASRDPLDRSGVGSEEGAADGESAARSSKVNSGEQAVNQGKKVQEAVELDDWAETAKAPLATAPPARPAPVASAPTPRKRATKPKSTNKVIHDAICGDKEGSPAGVSAPRAPRVSKPSKKEIDAQNRISAFECPHWKVFIALYPDNCVRNRGLTATAFGELDLDQRAACAAGVVGHLKRFELINKGRDAAFRKSPGEAIEFIKHREFERYQAAQADTPPATSVTIEHIVKNGKAAAYRVATASQRLLLDAHYKLLEGGTA